MGKTPLKEPASLYSLLFVIVQHGMIMFLMKQNTGHGFELYATGQKLLCEPFNICKAKMLNAYTAHGPLWCTGSLQFLGWWW